MCRILGECRDVGNVAAQFHVKYFVKWQYPDDEALPWLDQWQWGKRQWHIFHALMQIIITMWITPYNGIHTLDVFIETPHAPVCQISQHTTLFHFTVYLYGIRQDDGPQPFHYNWL